MEEITIENLAEALHGIHLKRFTSQVDKFVQDAAVLDQTLISGAEWPDKRRLAHDACYENIRREASRIKDLSTLSLNRLINFSCIRKIRNPLPDRDRQTQTYFSKIKKQQMEVLSAISDEIDIIQSMIDHARKMQTVLLTHSETLTKTAGLMGIIRERIVRRPTTLLRLEGRDRKIQQLNETFQRIQDFENTHAEGIRQEAEENPVTRAISSYHRLSLGTYSEIERRRAVIDHHGKDLKRGGKLLLRLAAKGYSPLMKRSLDDLVGKHEDRTRDFRDHIRKNRMHLYLKTEH